MSRLATSLLVGFTRALVGARAVWKAPPPAGPCLYFANHGSHLDTVALWSALTPRQRQRVRPVAARDYWDHAGLRRYIALELLDAVLIERRREHREGDPLEPLMQALRAGDSLILFPEGTRGSDGQPQAFRSGLFKLAEAFPTLDLVPVHLDTLHRALPKGARLPLPLPLYCTVRFGAPLARIPGESRDAFLERARQAVIDLS